MAILSPPFIWTLSAIGHLVVCLFLDFEGKAPFGGLVTNILVNIIGIGTLGPLVLAFVGFIVSPAVAIVGKALFHIPYFLKYFPHKLFFFEFGNGRKFK